MTLTFTNPFALWLLLLLPIIVLIGWLGIVYLPRQVRNAAVVVRVLITTALILALAQPVLHQSSNLLSVIYVVDRSASATFNGASVADQWVKQAMAQAGPNDHVGEVDFGANAVVTKPLGVKATVTPIPTVDPSSTNLAAALHLATSLFPPTGAHRIVVLSDGQANVGDVQAEARQDSTRDVQIDIVPVSPPSSLHEVLIRSVSAPPYLRVGQHFDLSTDVYSTSKTSGTLTLFRDGQAINQGQVNLTPGDNRFTVSLDAKDEGFHSYAAVIQSVDDTYSQNNQAFTYTVVKPAGKIAVVAANPQDANALVGALKNSGLSVDLLAPRAIPPSLNAVKGYDSIVVVNTPATDFTLDQMKTLAGFAHDLGHGLVVIGGEQSYGLGKYDGTPLGDALPVNGTVPGNVDNGKVALVLVIDKSGSMDETEGGVRKMAMADKAAQLAIGMLAPTDDIGVVAFDTDPTWVIPVQQVGDQNNRQKIEDQVGKIEASGGTDIFQALQVAYNGIHQSNARYKHIILASDGNSLVDSDYTQLLNHIQQEHITLSTIAIGTDADLKLMQMLAQKGNGRYYYTDQAADIPQITTRETRIVSGSAKVDSQFQPIVATQSPLLQSVVARNLPQLSGYVVTTPRDSAEVSLQSDRKDPILAEWNYGLGRVAAWTSDLSTHWANDWLKWSGFNGFWSQVVNWSMEPANDPNIQTSYDVKGAVVDFKVDVVNDQGVFQDLLDMRAQIHRANGQMTEVPLVQTRPGRYEAQFSITTPGAYPIDVVQYKGNQVVQQETAGVVVSYPSEYQNFGVNQQQLAAVAAMTGGQVLHDPSESFRRDSIDFQGQDSVDLWPWLLTLAAVLFPIDVAIRRLRVDPLDVIRRSWGNGRRGASGLGNWLDGQRRGAGQWLRRSIGLAIGYTIGLARLRSNS
jgi:Ca-activated chloride channel family protein